MCSVRTQSPVSFLVIGSFTHQRYDITKRDSFAHVPSWLSDAEMYNTAPCARIILGTSVRHVMNLKLTSDPLFLLLLPPLPI